MDMLNVFYKVFGISKEKQAEIDLKIIKWANNNTRLPEVIKELLAVEDKRELIATAFRLGYMHALSHMEDPLMFTAYQQWQWLRLIAQSIDDQAMLKILLDLIDKSEKQIRELKDQQYQGFG